MGDQDVIDSSLFKEIGNTLEEIGKVTLQTTVSSLKTAIARRSAATAEGQAVAYQNMTPYILLGLAVLAVIFFIRR